MGEFVRLLDDPTEGIEVTDGMMTLPKGVGSGVTLSAVHGESTLAISYT